MINSAMGKDKEGVESETKTVTEVEASIETSEDETEKGNMFHIGPGIEIDRNMQAVDLFKQAIEQGWLAGHTYIGDLYYYGHLDPLKNGTPNIKRALAKYRFAIKHRHARAAYNLGYMYEHGEGVNADLRTAKGYYHQAFQYARM